LKKGDTVTVTIAKHTDSTDTEKSQEEVSRQTTDTNANGGTRDSDYSSTSSGVSSDSDTVYSGSGDSPATPPDNTNNTPVSVPAPDSLPISVYDGESESEIRKALSKDYSGAIFYYQYADNPDDYKGVASYTKNADGSGTVTIYVPAN
ncbi:MAG: hypothetical protein PUF17_03555, partial [Lactimicrobium massiliense]